jgi:hypothetical protein
MATENVMTVKVPARVKGKQIVAEPARKVAPDKVKEIAQQADAVVNTRMAAGKKMHLLPENSDLPTRSSKYLFAKEAGIFLIVSNIPASFPLFKCFHE